MKKILIAFMLVSVGGTSAAADLPWKSFRREFGPVVATVEVSSDRITIGDVVECRMTVEAQPGVAVLAMPNLLDHPGNFAVLDYSVPQSKPLAGGAVQTTAWYKLDPTLSGEYAIPPQEIRFVDRRPGQDQGEHTFETPEVPIHVTGLVDGEAQWGNLKDIRAGRHGPLRIPWKWIALGLAAAGLGWAWVRFGRRKKEILDPPKPAHLIAEIELDRLMRESLLDRGEIEKFVTRLSDILRRYIENRFQLKAPRRSTEEFYEELQTSPVLDAAQKGIVVEFLRRADLVKFAADPMDPTNAIQLLDTVRRFVRQTRELDEPGRRKEMDQAA